MSDSSHSMLKRCFYFVCNFSISLAIVQVSFSNDNKYCQREHSIRLYDMVLHYLSALFTNLMGKSMFLQPTNTNTINNLPTSKSKKSNSKKKKTNKKRKNL